MIHKTIKEQIKEALRAHDEIRLNTLRGLNALFQNDMIANKLVTDFLPDEKVIPLIKKSVKQRKDSIDQFEKGNRKDLADREKAELVILETYLPKTMDRAELAKIVQHRIDELRKAGPVDVKSSGKVVGMLMKELSGRADGNDVKAIVENLLAS